MKKSTAKRTPDRKFMLIARKIKNAIKQGLPTKQLIEELHKKGGIDTLYKYHLGSDEINILTCYIILGDKEMVQFILELAKDQRDKLLLPAIKGRSSSFHMACFLHCYEIMRLMLQYKPLEQLLKPSADGMYPITLALLEKKRKTFKVTFRV